MAKREIAMLDHCVDATLWKGEADVAVPTQQGGDKAKKSLVTKEGMKCILPLCLKR